jgi:hypothetical protein
MRRSVQLLSVSTTLGLALWAGCAQDEPPFAAGGAGDPAPGVTIGTVACVSSSSSGGSGGSTGSGGSGPCNPVTNEGCSSGAACDTNLTQEKFQCYPPPPPNDNAICTPCGTADGWCAPTLTCVEGACARFCCNDDDCGPEATCDLTLFADYEGGLVGACLRQGTGGAPATHDCDAPATAPSNGSCFGSSAAGGSGGSGGN